MLTAFKALIPKHSGPFEVVAQVAHDITCLDQRPSAENEHDTLSSDFASW